MVSGWQPDPFGLHEYRYFARGRPTALVHDGDPVAGWGARTPASGSVPTAPASPATSTPPARKARSRRRRTVGVLVAVGALLLVLVAVGTSGKPGGSQPAQRIALQDRSSTRAGGDGPTGTRAPGGSSTNGTSGPSSERRSASPSSRTHTPGATSTGSAGSLSSGAAAVAAGAPQVVHPAADAVADVHPGIPLTGAPPSTTMSKGSTTTHPAGTPAPTTTKPTTKPPTTTTKPPTAPAPAVVPVGTGGAGWAPPASDSLAWQWEIAHPLSLSSAADLGEGDTTA
ncbi:MAG TPA: hypothetical protein VGL60_00005, partial [Acidimicrobiales bacterium]